MSELFLIHLENDICDTPEAYSRLRSKSSLGIGLRFPCQSSVFLAPQVLDTNIRHKSNAYFDTFCATFKIHALKLVTGASRTRSPNPTNHTAAAKSQSCSTCSMVFGLLLQKAHSTSCSNPLLASFVYVGRLAWRPRHTQIWTFPGTRAPHSRSTSCSSPQHLLLQKAYSISCSSPQHLLISTSLERSASTPIKHTSYRATW